MARKKRRDHGNIAWAYAVTLREIERQVSEKFERHHAWLYARGEMG